jgi:predicted N-acetyltransferase YhbS
MVDHVTDLADGLLLRTAVAADLDQIAQLLADRGDDADAEDVRLVADDPDEGLGSVMVVVDGDRVVSTATLLQESVTIGGVVVPSGQVELVATLPEYEGRGLVRALMNEAHRRSEQRGDLLQVMIGIPNFYRQFGYAYSMPIPLPRVVAVPVAPPAGIVVRPATADDISAMRTLQDTAQSTADVRMSHSAACWRWMVARSGSTQLVAERQGTIVATARRTPPDEGMALAEMAGDVEGMQAIIAASSVESDGPVEVVERPGTPLDAILSEVADAPDDDTSARSREWFYARVPALAPLFERLEPALVSRVRSAGLGAPTDVLLSSWRSHVRFSISEDSMSPVETGGPEQRPISKGGAGVPVDLLAPLLLGPFGSAGLERRHADVSLGRLRDVMEALFPPVTSDLMTFYLAL